MKIDLLTVVRKGWIAILILALVGLAFYRLKLAPISVTVATVNRAPVFSEVMGTGTLEARYQTAVGSKIQGRLVGTLVDQNDPVKTGQLVARLDDAELSQEVAIERATLDAATATVKRVKAEEAKAKAVLDQADRDFQRYSSLVESKSISQENAEKSKERLAVARADYDKAVAATTEARKQVTTAEAKLRHSETKLADTRIVSPFEGLVVRRDREAGDIIVPGTSIFQIISLKEMWISAWVDESSMAGLATGQPARIVFRSQPKKDYKGKVARLGKEVDRETREFKVDVDVETLPENWAVGQRAEVYVRTAQKAQALAIPVKALVWRQGKPEVFVVKNGKAELRTVTLGMRGLKNMEIAKGLSEGEKVILEPARRKISDGRRVSVR